MHPQEAENAKALIDTAQKLIDMQEESSSMDASSALEDAAKEHVKAAIKTAEACVEDIECYVVNALYPEGKISEAQRLALKVLVWKKALRHVDPRRIMDDLHRMAGWEDWEEKSEDAKTIVRVAQEATAEHEE